MTKALCLGREYHWQITQEKRRVEKNESREIDVKVLAKSLQFRIKLKKREIKQAKSRNLQQMSELEQLLRQESQLEGEMAAASKVGDTYTTALEHTRES